MTAYLGGQQLTPTGHAVGTAPKAGQTCVACHGSDGIGILPEYPNLAGQHADYIEQALKAYRAGQRKNPVMGGMASPLTDADIKALAQYYSSQRPGLCSTRRSAKPASARAPEPGTSRDLTQKAGCARPSCFRVIETAV